MSLYKECCGCHYRFQDGQQIFEYDGFEFCESCYDKRVKRCEHCGNLYFVHNMDKTANGYVCKECKENQQYQKCTICYRYHSAGITKDGRFYCNHCYKNTFSPCPKCGKDIRKRFDTVYFVGEHICFECYNKLPSCVKCCDAIPEGREIKTSAGIYCTDCIGKAILNGIVKIKE